MNVSIPSGLQNYQTTTSVSTDPNPVKIFASFNATSGIITWTMESVDPVTGGLPEDPLAGFLPPNKPECNRCGEGYVSFLVWPKTGLASGTSIPNQARIVFDVNPPIDTAQVINTLDDLAATSTVNRLPSTSQATFTVSWTGSDPGGSGIAFYDIYHNRDGGGFVPWILGTTQTSAIYSGAVGHSYGFYSVATDNVGNQQVMPSEAQTSTLVTSQTLQPFPFVDDYSTDKGWIGYETGGWERGPALSGGGETGNPDPGKDYSPSEDNYILGFAIGADYPNDIPEEKSIISPPIDCTGQDLIFLKFRRWLNVEGNGSDRARIYVSTNGNDWTQVWENPPIDLKDNQWIPMVLDISEIASNQSTLYIKFTLGPNNSSRRFSGWNIDDFEVTSEAVYPSEGTFGTEIKIYGLGFGAKPGKVLFRGINGHIYPALKIIEWKEGFISCSISKVVNSGIYDIVIQPGEPKGASIIYKEAFVMRTPEIYSIDPSEGTTLDEVTVEGKFFGTKKGKVSLECEGKGTIVRKTCKVLTWMMHSTTGDSEVVFVVPKMVPSECDLILDAYGAIPEVVEEDAFSVMAPEIEEVKPNPAEVGEWITIKGNYFGRTKGKVYLSYPWQGRLVKKNCFVDRWSDDEILFVVPKLPPDNYDLIVTNSVGSVTWSQKIVIE